MRHINFYPSGPVSRGAALPSPAPQGKGGLAILNSATGTRFRNPDADHSLANSLNYDYKSFPRSSRRRFGSILWLVPFLALLGTCRPRAARSKTAAQLRHFRVKKHTLDDTTLAAAAPGAAPAALASTAALPAFRRTAASPATSRILIHLRLVRLVRTSDGLFDPCPCPCPCSCPCPCLCGLGRLHYKHAHVTHMTNCEQVRACSAPAKVSTRAVGQGNEMSSRVRSRSRLRLRLRLSRSLARCLSLSLS